MKSQLKPLSTIREYGSTLGMARKKMAAHTFQLQVQLFVFCFIAV